MISLNWMDLGIVILYVAVVFAISWDAGAFMTRFMRPKPGEPPKPVENHYLAGKSISFWEAVLSMVATEFSALAFLTIPTYVYFEDLSYLRFVIGACVSRVLIIFFILPKIYGKGLTIFEVLARGPDTDLKRSEQEKAGEKTFAAFYVGTKIIGVGVKLVSGATLVAAFLDTSVFMSILLIALITYLYIMVGGLKAVVRTDMLQAGVFVAGGIMAHYVLGTLSNHSWSELLVFGANNGKFNPLGNGGGLSFAYGVLAGLAYDLATHGVDQDFAQKLLGSQDVKTARKALAWSAVGSLLVNLLFLSLGVVLWAYYTKIGQLIPPSDEIFSMLIESKFPSPVKGVMVASLLAACMSTLDSSINAMSTCLWNDLMRVKNVKMVRVFINLDNLIVTLSICIVAYLFSKAPELAKYGLYFAYLATTPLLALFICRMILWKWVKFNYSPSIIMMSIIACFWGMALNHFRFGFNPQLTILWGIVMTVAFVWIYSRINNAFLSKLEAQS